MRGYSIVGAILVAMFVMPLQAMAQDNRPEQPPALPDPNFAGTFNSTSFDGQPLLKKKCIDDSNDPVESQAYEIEGWDAAND